uniref:Immunoglobulin V-set domain-containing protein n=1 Tax=Poecilia latipinna TaxID=48699 RepID=A0A3B3V6L3_9TELE
MKCFIGQLLQNRTTFREGGSFSSEGSSATVSYNYSKAAVYDDYFFWYRQYPGKPPEFLISHTGTGTQTSQQLLGFSFSVSDDKTRMDLLISSAAVTDSAVYYCAVQPTVTGNTRTLDKNLQYSTAATRGPHSLSHQGATCSSRRRSPCALCSSIVSIRSGAVKRTAVRLNVEHQLLSPAGLNLVGQMEHWLWIILAALFSGKIQRSTCFLHMEEKSGKLLIVLL